MNALDSSKMSVLDYIPVVVKTEKFEGRIAMAFIMFGATLIIRT